MIISLFRTILVLSIVFVIHAERNTPCITPNGENAICIPLSSCTVIQNALYTFNETAAQFARNSQCGADTEPLLCCGSTAYPVFGTDPPESKLLPNRTVCGFGAQDDRVLGGELTEIGEFPWMALLGYINSVDNSSAGFKCGGTLINNRYVLTAAHCVRVVATSGIELNIVRLGEWQISTPIDCEERTFDECADPVLDLQIEEKIAHRDYSKRSGDNDIALLRLEKNVKYTDYIRAICLPSFNAQKLKPGVQLIVSGWGTIENGTTSDYKLKLKVPVISNKDCSATIKNRGQVGDNQVCAGGEQGKDACQGDSGGPLMGTYEKTHNMKIQWYQEGVVAWGIGCGRKNIPAVYTRVAKYLNWILDNMSEF